MVTKKVERVHNGTSLPEQIIYNWLKEEFGEENVVNRDISHEGLEFDVYVKPLELLIEYGDNMYHNYKSDIKEIDIKKVKYAKENNIKLLRVFNDGESNSAYLNGDLLVFNIKTDKFLVKQVLPLIGHYINDCYGVAVDVNTMNEKILAQAIANTYYSPYKDSFGEKYPELAQYWCDSENFGVNPNAISIACPYEFIFTCPECGHRFKSTIQKFIDDSVCKCCGHNVRFGEEEVVSIYKMKGMHNNIDCFILNKEELRCGYNEILYSVISSAIDTGNAGKLVNSKIIKHVSNIKGLKSYTLIGEYGVKIPKQVQLQYDMLMDAIVSLNIDFSDFKVKVKQKEYDNITIQELTLFDLAVKFDNQTEEINIETEKDKVFKSSIFGGTEKRSKKPSITNEDLIICENYINAISNSCGKYEYVNYVNNNFNMFTNPAKCKISHIISASPEDNNRIKYFMGIGHLTEQCIRESCEA